MMHLYFMVGSHVFSSQADLANIPVVKPKGSASSDSIFDAEPVHYN
jgi:hypothetical protein